MAQIYDVTLELTEPMLGTVPVSKEIHSAWILKLQADRVHPPGELVASNETETVPEEVNVDAGYTSFMKDHDGIFVYDYFIKGFLKNAGNILKEELKVDALKSKINNTVFVFPRKIMILDHDGTVLKEPQGSLERPLLAQSKKGPRVALAKSDIVSAGCRLKFEIHVLECCKIKHIETVLESILQYGQYQALGQWRNAGFGRVKIVEFSFRKPTETDAHHTV